MLRLLIKKLNKLIPSKKVEYTGNHPRTPAEYGHSYKTVEDFVCPNPETQKHIASKFTALHYSNNFRT